MNAVSFSTTGIQIPASWSSNSQSSQLLNYFLGEGIKDNLCSYRSLGMPFPKANLAIKVNLLGSQATLFPQQTPSITSLKKFLSLNSAFTVALVSLVVEAPKM
jgi:hypothetical protein